MKRFIPILLLSLSVSFQVFADWKIVIKTTSSDGLEYESIFYIKKGVLRQETTEMNVIINLNTNNIIYANNKTNSYWQGTKAEFENEIEELMKTMMVEMMGEEAYKQMKEMDKENTESESVGNFEVEINMEGGSIEMAGFTGTKHSVVVDGELAEELWLCKDIDAFNEFDFEEMGKMFEENGQNDYTNSEKYKRLITDKGFPVKQISYDYGEMTETVELISADDASLLTSVFDPPAGYTKTGLLQVMGMEE